MSKIQAGDTVRTADARLWNVAQVHTSDHSADIWRTTSTASGEQRVERSNVSLNALTKVTS